MVRSKVPLIPRLRSANLMRGSGRGERKLGFSRHEVTDWRSRVGFSKKLSESRAVGLPRLEMRVVGVLVGDGSFRWLRGCWRKLGLALSVEDERQFLLRTTGGFRVALQAVDRGVGRTTDRGAHRGLFGEERIGGHLRSLWSECEHPRDP